EVGQFPDMMDLNPFPRSTEFALVRQQSRDEFRSRWRSTVLVFGLVLKFQERVCPQSETSESCNQRCLARPFDLDFKAFEYPLLMIGHGLVSPGHLRDGCLVLVCQGLEHGCLHGPMQPAEPESICGIG